ncbi:MAG: 16S rRNA (cytosine(1402)-N(4))-methyltransferase RsmH [Lentisphaeraceae bacterium]|nr:16S rRNA (cytosine(1402)-N(4))-methyltransferase RsmH [Lentisphaeraceae bacterium]
MGESFEHIPVLPQEVLEYLKPERGGRYIDCTLGGGGHSRMILEASKDVKLLGLDQDEDALKAASENLKEFGDRFSCRKMNFGEIHSLAGTEWDKVDGILMDIGVSSHQIDTAERGFSYVNDGPLDMRMDRSQDLTAADILNETDERGLTRIFRVYGEERYAKRIAKAVVRERENEPWTRTGKFADLIQKIVGRRKAGSAPAPARCFQALRIAVNRELEVLEDALSAGFEFLKPGGRLVVICFHSLEDRIVKNFFREKSLTCECPPEIPVCVCKRKAEVKIVSRKAVQAGEKEIEFNRRSACSKLRAAEKI